MRLLLAFLLCTALAQAQEPRVKLKLSDAPRQKPAPAALSFPLPEQALTELLVRLRGTSSGPRTGWRWWNHENLRDERAEAFATVLEPGVYEYSYRARATTRGSFTAGPAKAEEMYAPETYGRCGSDRLVVD